MNLRSVAPGAPLGDLLRTYWLPFLPGADLPPGAERPARVQLLEERLVAFRSGNGDLGLIHGLCPHARGDMFFSAIEPDGIRCNYHGWKFDTAGTCIETPMHGGNHGIDTLAYPVRQHGGLLWAYLGIGDPPALPELALESATAARRNRPWIEMVAAELAGDADALELSVQDTALNASGQASLLLPGILSRANGSATIIVPADEKSSIVINGTDPPQASASTIAAVREALERLVRERASAAA